MSKDKFHDSIVMKKGSGVPQYAVIWLHGLGADASDFTGLVPMLNLPESMVTTFVLPNAPSRPVTLNAGFMCRAWFDIYSLHDFTRRDDKGIQESIATITALIDQQQQAGIRSDRIILAGFSQGGIIALAAGLQYPKPLAGILALSTFLPWSEQELRQTLSVSRQVAPVLQMHGERDDVIPINLGKSVSQLLNQQNYPMAFKTYPMAHEVCPQQVADISQWMTDRFSHATEAIPVLHETVE